MEKISLLNLKRTSVLLEGLKLAESTDIPTSNTLTNASIEASDLDASLAKVEEASQCLCCNCSFTSREDQVVHFKSDWHRYNIKLRLHGAVSISEEEFENILDEISSISGSDSDDDSSDEDTESDGELRLNKAFDRITVSVPLSPDKNDQTRESVNLTRSPKMTFVNHESKFISMYKCVLPYMEKNEVTTNMEKITAHLLSPIKCCIILLSAGHFAGAVFEGNEVRVHKTFHRYIIRAKQGTMQSANDKKTGGSSAKSAGASLRRHNEAALVKDIQEQVMSWKQAYIDDCSSIFLRVPQYHKSIFYNGKNAPFTRKDNRIHGIPFPTRRPTFSELKRVWQELYNAEISAKFEDEKSHVTSKDVANKPNEKYALQDKTQNQLNSEILTSCTKNTPRPKKKQKKKMKVDEIAVDSPGTETVTQDPIQDQSNDDKSSPVQDLKDELYTVCKLGDLEGLKAVLLPLQKSKNNDSTVENTPNLMKTILNQSLDSKSNTLLHIASKSGNKDIVYHLLASGADPAIKNASLAVPYSLCSDKPVRNVYRRFMADFPDKYDYKRALVPGPLTEEMEKEMKKRANEKKKAQKAVKKEKQKEQKAEKALKAREDEEMSRFAALSDREKRAIAAERRFAKQIEGGTGQLPLNSKRCWLCGETLLGKIPFEYLEYEFCAMACLKKHKSLQKL